MSTKQRNPNQYQTDEPITIGTALVQYLQTLSQPQKEPWNLLFKKTANPDERVSVREFLNRELAIAERERIIRRFNPVWTAVVRDKKQR